MTDAIEVHVDHAGGTHLVGRCRFVAKRHARSSVFEYADEWLERPDAFAIDPTNLPLDDRRIHTSSPKSALPGSLRDAAPDRWGRMLVRRAYRKSEQERALSEIDYLLAINDQTRIGALRCRFEGENRFDRDAGNHRIPPLVHLPALVSAANAIQTNTETAEDLKLLLNEGSPLGGARPKSAVMDDDGAPAIAKFPKADDDRSIAHGEVLAMKLAARAGVNAAPARLVNAAGRPVALIARFDRRDGRRIPFLSAMSLLGLDDGEDAAYTDIAERIRMHSSEPTADLRELWRRIVFGVLIGNLDDHPRNHGFLYDGDGKWRLSPAYDLNPVPAEERARELTTWISEEGPAADLDIARRAAPFFALAEDQAEAVIAEVRAALKGWRDVARRLGMDSADTAAYSTAIRDGP